MEHVSLEIDFSDAGFDKYVRLLKAGKIHVACFASDQPGSCCQQAVRAVTQLNPKSLVDKVNQADDVGCLHPIAKISILPRFQPERDDAQQHLIRNLRELIYEGNEKYIRCEHIVLLLDSTEKLNYNLLAVALRLAMDGDPATGESVPKKPEWLRRISLHECQPVF